MLLRLTALCLFLLGTSLAFGQSPIVELNENVDEVKIGKGVLVFADSLAELDLEEALMATYTPAEDETIGFGPSSEIAYWLKFNLATGHSEEDVWMLQFDYALLDSINYYLYIGDSLVSAQEYGDLKPFSERPVDYRRIVIPMNLVHDMEYTVLIRVRTESSYQLGMTISKEEKFYNRVTKEEIFYGIIYGIFLVMALYNLFVFFTLKDWNYVWYALSIGALALFFACLYGHAYQYLWPENTFFGNRAIHFSMGLIAVSNPVFARRFLDLKKYAKVFDVWCKVIFYLGIVATVISLITPFSFNAVWVTRVLLLTIPAVLLGSFWAWAKGNKAARFFAIAWLPFLLGGALIMMRNLGMVPTNNLTSNGIILGATVQVVFLSLALGDRYRLIKAEQERVQAENAQILKEANVTLELKVAERTQELQESNEELNVTLETIQQQNDLIQKKNEKITDSIRYASLIQNAMLPLDERLMEGFPNHFIFFLPRDIVSGDFYWYQEHQGKYFAGVVDCTGHGVPGALMSMIGANVLNTLVGQHDIVDPGTILTRMHEDVERALKQKDTKNRDGMDAAIVVWDPQAKTLQFAGARNSMIYFQNGEQLEMKADRMSIAGRVIRSAEGEERTFTTHTVNIETTTEFYLYSDGYKDQFGGGDGRKLMQKNFVKLLADIHKKDLAEQKQIMNEHFEGWTANHEQIDDVLVMGFRVG